MSFWLGGFRVVSAGWLGPQAVYCDLVSELDAYLYQIYENRNLVGSTTRPGERRVIGHLAPSLSPAPLSVVRVDLADQFTDFGPLLPIDYINRYEMVWTSVDSSAVETFAIVASAVEGGDIDTSNILGELPFTGDGTYRWQLDAFSSAGTWKFGVMPKDAGGNLGSLVEGTLVVAMPPPDVRNDRKGNRFSASAASGVVSVSWGYQ